MFAHPLYHCACTGIAHTEALAGQAVDIGGTRRGTIQRHIAHNDVFFGGEGRIGGREENQFPAGQPFPEIIVAVAA